MKRLLSFILSFVYFVALIFSLIIFIKPGAAIFYRKSQIQTQGITQLENAFEVKLNVDNYIYNPDSILVFEDQEMLTVSIPKKAKSGENGVFALHEVKKDNVSILFTPSSPSNPSINEHTYRIYIRPYLISRTSGAIAFSTLLLGFLAISLIDPQNRKIVLHSPFGIVILWANGVAGCSIIKNLDKIEVDFVVQKVLVPIILLALYCGSFAYLSSRYEYEGVNYNFVSILWRYLLLLIVVIYLVVFVVSKLKKINTISFKSTHEKLVASDFLLLLFPLTPIVQYLIINRDSLTSNESIYVLLFFVLFSSLFILIIPELLGIFSSKRTLMMLGLAFVFTIIDMALLSKQFLWYESGSLWIQLLVFCGVFLASRHINKKVLYIFIVINFIANGALQIISSKETKVVSSIPIDENRLFVSVEDKKPSTTPNIYLLVYDSYVPNETMLGYGIDNSLQEDFLIGQGFNLYPHIYTVGSSTISSMSKVLNVSTEYYGDKRRGISGDGVVQNLFKNNGYRTWGMFTSGFMFLNIGSSYDYSIPEGQINSSLTEGILLGEFRSDLGFYDQSKDGFIKLKHSVLKDISGKPTFVYMHSNIPGHSQTSGICLESETKFYKEKLISANSEMKQDVENIITNDPNGIIIIAGDHGPRLTKNCLYTSGVYDISEISRLDIQDRFGSFLAIRWPTEEYEEFDEITVLQDIFPAIFAYIYDDETILQSKIDPVTVDDTISGAYVKDGIIYGGIDDGEPLYLSDH